jgi:hypothetical protein
MRLLRGLLGALLWILASVLGLIGVLLCVTVILLPVGIPLVKLAGSFFVRSMKLMLPPSLAHPVDNLVAHPVDNLAMAAKKKRRKVGSAMSDAAHDAAKKGRKVAKRQRKRLERIGGRSASWRDPRRAFGTVEAPRQHLLPSGQRFGGQGA